MKMPPVKKSLLFTPVKNIIWEELFLKIFSNQSKTSLRKKQVRKKSVFNSSWRPQARGTGFKNDPTKSL